MTWAGRSLFERLYTKQFGRERPDVVRSIEETARLAERRRAERKAQSTVEDAGE